MLISSAPINLTKDSLLIKAKGGLAGTARSLKHLKTVESISPVDEQGTKNGGPVRNRRFRRQQLVKNR